MDVLQLPSSIRSTLARVFDPNTPLLGFIPKWIKVIFLLLVLTNSSSFPFAWHWRLWNIAFLRWGQAKALGGPEYLRRWKKWFDEHGGIEGYRERKKRIVLFDDADYNMHMSNSSYAKNSDAVKMHYAIDAFGPIWGAGAFMALGASHWVYLKEIPIGAEYVMETRMGGWGDKWMHCVTEFIVYPKGKKKERSASPAPTILPNASVPPSGADTPASRSNSPTNGEDAVKRVNARLREPRADGGITCCISVTDYCFKVGRITVPPRIAMWICMMSPEKSGQDEAFKTLTSKDRGRKFLRGGWKERPDADSLGRNIAHDGEISGAQWFAQAERAMEKVSEGLAYF